MTQITEDYCSFEIANLLKEKGFDENCSRSYVKGKLAVSQGFNNSYYTTMYSDDCYRPVSAPTLQMAMKWLREREWFICVIPLAFYCGEKVSKFGYSIWAGDNFEVDEENTPEFTTYEDACEAAIKYCLENLI